MFIIITREAHSQTIKQNKKTNHRNRKKEQQQPRNEECSVNPNIITKYSPNGTLYISRDADKENLFNNQELLSLVIVFSIVVTLTCHWGGIVGRNWTLVSRRGQGFRRITKLNNRLHFLIWLLKTIRCPFFVLNPFWKWLMVDTEEWYSK